MAETYDPDGAGPLAPEPIERIAGASPALHHLQTPVLQGSSTYSIYMYVTWVDSETDGIGASDEADGNGDGEPDASGEDVKRTTVVVTWADSFGGTMQHLTMGSLFSQGTIPYQGAAAPANVPPVVGCPTYTASGLDVDFAADVSDEDGTVVSIDWDFGDGGTGTGAAPSHTYAAVGTYTIVNDATDDDGGIGTNDGQDCEVVVTTSGGGAGPDGTISIASGAAYTTQTQVTLILGAPGATVTTQMQFSDDGTTWSTPEDYETSRIYTLPERRRHEDRLRTVHRRRRSRHGHLGHDRARHDATGRTGDPVRNVHDQRGRQDRGPDVERPLPGGARPGRLSGVEAEDDRNDLGTGDVVHGGHDLL